MDKKPPLPLEPGTQNNAFQIAVVRCRGRKRGFREMKTLAQAPQPDRHQTRPQDPLQLTAGSPFPLPRCPGLPGPHPVPVEGALTHHPGQTGNLEQRKWKWGSQGSPCPCCGCPTSTISQQALPAQLSAPSSAPSQLPSPQSPAQAVMGAREP